MIDTSSLINLRDMVWLHLCEKQIQGRGKKLKPIRYGPFEIVQHVGENALKLELPPYMSIYSVINADNLKLFEPSMFDKGKEELPMLPEIEDLVPDVHTDLEQDVVLQRKLRETRRDRQELLRIGLKGKWYLLEEVKDKFPLLIQNLETPKKGMKSLIHPTGEGGLIRNWGGNK